MDSDRQVHQQPTMNTSLPITTTASQVATTSQAHIEQIISEPSVPTTSSVPVDTSNVTMRKSRKPTTSTSSKCYTDTASGDVFQVISGGQPQRPISSYQETPREIVYNTSMFNESTTAHSIIGTQQGAIYTPWSPTNLPWQTNGSAQQGAHQYAPPLASQPGDTGATSIMTSSPNHGAAGTEVEYNPNRMCYLQNRMEELSLLIEQEEINRKRFEEAQLAQLARRASGEAASDVTQSSPLQLPQQQQPQQQAVVQQPTNLGQQNQQVAPQTHLQLAQYQLSTRSQFPQVTPQQQSQYQFGTSLVSNQNHNIPKIPFPSMKKDNIEMWFIQVDRWFNTYHVTTQIDKFNYVVSVLDGNQMVQLYEAISNPPTDRPFDNLKEAIIRNYSDSEQKRIQKLIAGFRLGDYKPSQLLNIIRSESSAVYNKDSPFIKQIWMNSLPDHVKIAMTAVTAVAPNSSLQALADAADKVMEQAGSSLSTVNAVHDQPPRQSSGVAGNDDLREMRKLLGSLHRRLKAIENRGRGRSISPSGPKQDRSRSKSPYVAKDTSLCGYHNRYGDKAKLCAEGCRLNDGKLPLGKWKPKNH